jgi:hypothetical protein
MSRSCIPTLVSGAHLVVDWVLLTVSSGRRCLRIVGDSVIFLVSVKDALDLLHVVAD